MKLVWLVCALLCSGYCFAKESAMMGQEMEGRMMETRMTSQEDEQRLRETLFTKYNKEILPNHDRMNPVKVSLGLSVVAIRDVDIREQAMDIEGWVQYGWNDSRLTWNPQEYGGIDRIRVEMKRLWRPDVTLYNAAKSNDFELVESPKTISALVYNNGKVLWVPATSMRAFCDLDLTKYPYDIHTCSLNFGSWVYDGYHVDLMLDETSRITRTIDLTNLRNNSEWRIMRTSVEKKTTIYPCCPEPYPSIIFSLTISRQSPSFQMAIILPVIVGFILTVAGFMISPFRIRRLVLNAFNLIIFMRTITHMEYKLASVGTQTPLIVLISESMTVLLTVSMCWSMMMISMRRTMRMSQPPEMLHRFLNSWTSRMLFIPRDTTTMQNCCKKVSEMDRDMKMDPEMMPIMTEEGIEERLTTGWMKFFLFLDRMAFIGFFTILTLFILAFRY